jgi:putative PIN family toxin of toxin-antitoxin system
MRIVIDANVLVSGIFWGGYPLRVLDLWVREQVHVLVTEPIMLEYGRVLAELGRKEARSSLARRRTVFVAQHAMRITEVTIVSACRDPHDDKYLACAVDGFAGLCRLG